MSTESKPERMWGIRTEQAPWEETIGGKLLSPALDFVIRTGEIILLTGAFQAAAVATNNNGVRVVAQTMFLALYAHLGLAYARYVLVPLFTRPKRVTILKFVIAAAVAITLPFLLKYLTSEVSAAARAIASSAELTKV